MDPLVFNAELQRQKKLISSGKIIKIPQAVLEIFNLKIETGTAFRGKTAGKPKMLFLEVLHKLKKMDCVTSEMISTQLNNKQSRIFPFLDLIQT